MVFALKIENRPRWARPVEQITSDLPRSAGGALGQAAAFVFSLTTLAIGISNGL